MLEKEEETEEEEIEEESEKEEVKKNNNKKDIKKINEDKKNNKIGDNIDKIAKIKNINIPKKAKIKQKHHINKNFEKEIVDAYKKLLKLNQFIEDKNNPNEEEEEEEDENITNQINSYNHYCENKLRSALKISENDPEMMIDRNIIDKLSRIALNNKMNLNYILGNIYISLMNKEYLLDYDNENNFEVNDLVMFINKVIQFREEIKNTRIYISYNYHLTKFLMYIKDQFDLEEEQFESINQLLEENKEINHKMKTSYQFLNKFFFKALIKELEIQPNIYEQFQIFIQNKKNIMNMIENSDLKEENYLEWYLKFGKILAYMFYNKSCELYVKKSEKDESDEDGQLILFYDGEKNEDEFNFSFIDGRLFNCSIDEKIRQMRMSLADIIICYSEKFIKLTNYFEFQFLIFNLLSRLYTLRKEKKEIIPLFVNSSINMCFFKDSPINFISFFINKILSSKKQEFSEIKSLFSQKISEAKHKKDFLYERPKEDEDEDDLTEEELEELITKESLYLLHNDLGVGFFNQKEIYAGEKFIFYEEISNYYSLLDFYFDLNDYDIKFTITDLTFDKIIYNKERVTSKIETPIKMLMFFTEPRILKFEFDNSYSWFTSKTIKYKANIFYPKYPFQINQHILIKKFIEDLSEIRMKIDKKNKQRKKTYNDGNIPNELLIAQINGKHQAFNCLGIEVSIKAIDKMKQNKKLSIISLFIKLKEKKEDKSYFYYYSKENEGKLVEKELIKESFENFINKVTIKNILTLINLYILNNTKKTIAEYPLKKILGFEPKIKAEGSLKKLLFFVLDLNEAQILYFIYKQLIIKESIDIIILINYMEYSGFQISLFNNEKITHLLSEFKGLNKELSSEENTKIIFDGIKKLKFGQERKIKIILGNCGDNMDNDNMLDKLKEAIEKNGNEMGNINVIKTDMGFNKEFLNNSHIFYLFK